MTEQDLVKNAYYRNIKNGKRYKLIGVAKHSENLEEQLAMYHEMYGDFNFWVRPLELFLVKFEPWQPQMPTGNVRISDEDAEKHISDLDFGWGGR